MNFRDWFLAKRRQRRFSDQIPLCANILGDGVQLRGTLTGSGDYRVNGRFEGDADIEGTVVLQPGAHWKGDIAADNIVIGGEVHGNVTARNNLELTASARIHGDLASPTIAIAEGALYQGQVRTAKRSPVRHFQERRGIEHAPPPGSAPNGTNSKGGRG
ncbi:MAG: polymer-forming cytoskeletal protein [Gammaproteobacteria bacterium]|nr:polymer-forming cytoskeletal protein [Gammaproteobacteria bacterium]